MPKTGLANLKGPLFWKTKTLLRYKGGEYLVMGMEVSD